MTSIERIVAASSSIRSCMARSIASAMMGAMLRMTTMAPIDARSSASIDEASMNVKRRGMVVAHLSTSRTEPKCKELDVATSAITVVAIWIMTTVIGKGRARSTTLLMIIMPALQTM